MKFIPLAAALLFASVLPAQNLIRDFDCDKTPMSPEFKKAEGATQSNLTLFEEDSTWNHCLKFELAAYSTDKNGKRHVSTAVMIGGDEKLDGFPCQPDTTYRFSLEIKGNASRAMLNYFEWDNLEKTSWTNRKKLRTDIHLIHPQKDWTVYRGTFKTTASAKRAALCIQFWGDESANQLQEKLGDYILIDKIHIEKVESANGLQPAGGGTASSGEKIVPASVCVASYEKEKPFQIPSFKDLKEDKAAKYPSAVKVYADSSALHFELDYRGAKPEANYSGVGGKAIWNDDLAEFFFDSTTPDKRLSQFVVSAGGGRWMGNGSDETVRNYDGWSASTRIHPDGWSASVTIPFAVLGYAEPPSPGTFIRFNITRQHSVEGTFLKPDYSKGNQWGGHRMVDNSSFSFANGDFHDKTTFGVLFFGSMKQYTDAALKEITAEELKPLAAKIDPNRPGEAWTLIQTLQNRQRILNLSKESFLAVRIPPDSDPSIPFLPAELNRPQGACRLRAAINEQAPLVFALANMSSDFEEYRVTLTRGWRRAEPQNEWPTLLPGLEQEDGTVFPADKITIRRGVPYKDSEAENRGKRFDILAKVNEVSSVPVMPRSGAPVWITFDCRDVKPGVYRGTFMVTPLTTNRFRSAKFTNDGMAVDDDTKSISVELEVLPIALEENSMPLNGFRSAYNQYQFDFMKEYQCGMYMVTPYFFTVKFNRDGSIEKSSPRSFLEPHIQLIMRNGKFIPKGMKKIMIGYGAYQIYKDIHWPKDLFQFDSPAYWNGWREWVKNMDSILRRNGASTEDYTVEVVDEPSKKNFSDVELAKAYSEAKKAVPGIHLTTTAGSPEFMDALKDPTDSWIFSKIVVYHPEYRKDVETFRKLSGKTRSVYLCGTSMRQDLYRYYRLLPWTALDSDGDYVSLFQFFEQLPGLDFRHESVGSVAYDTMQSLVPSVRLENLRIGMTDVRYLRLLKKYAVGDSPAAIEAGKFLDRAANEGSLIYPHDTGKADEIRSKAIDLLLRLEKK